MKYCWGVAVFSCCGILLQLLLTRLFSITLAYHFTFMVISLIMLTLAAPGIALYSFPRLFRGKASSVVLGGLCLGFGLMLVAALAIYLNVNLRVAPSDFSHWTRPQGQWHLLIIFGLWTIPFLLGGFVPAVLFSRFPRRFGLLYGWDLVGAAFGGILYIVLLTYVSGITALVLSASLVCLGGVFFAGGTRLRLAIGCVAAAGLLAVLAAGNAMLWPNSPLRVRYAKYYIEPTPKIEKWTPVSRITVFEPGRIGPLKKDKPFAWAMSPNYTGGSADELWMEQDACAGTPITAWDGTTSASVGHVLWDVTSLAFHLRPGAKVFIVGAGGGRDILAALLSGAVKVTAAEMNPGTIQVMTRYLGDFSGRLYANPAVSIVHDEARALLRNTRDKYDVIEISLVDTQAATAAGGLVFVENLLYTFEASKSYLNHLTDDGMLSVSWYYLGTPPAMLFRMIAGVRDALYDMGIGDPARYLALVRNDTVGNILVKRTPWSPTEIAELKSACERMGFSVLIEPGRMPGDPDLADLLHAPERLADRYPINLAAVTDDSPFIFQAQKWGTDTSRVPVDLRWNMAATRLLGQLLIGVTVASLLIICLPLLWRSRRLSRLPTTGRRFPWIPAVMITTGCGAGYLVVEISLMHLGIIMVGYPVYSLVLVLCAMLTGSGLAAVSSGAWPGRFRPSVLFPVMLLLVPLLLMLGWFLSRGADFGQVSLAWHWRAVLVFVVSFTLGGFMGLPFPSLLRMVSEEQGNEAGGRVLPWLWGINGMVGVVASVLVMYFAVYAGYSVALYVAGGCYAAVAAGFGVLAWRNTRVDTRSDQQQVSGIV